jgi:hypothetical protein
MKAYLVLDLTVNDFGGFRKYIAEIPTFIAKLQENTSFKGFSQRRSRAIGNPNAWSSSNFQHA